MSTHHTQNPKAKASKMEHTVNEFKNLLAQVDFSGVRMQLDKFEKDMIRIHGPDWKVEPKDMDIPVGVVLPSTYEDRKFVSELVGFTAIDKNDGRVIRMGSLYADMLALAPYNILTLRDFATRLWRYDYSLLKTFVYDLKMRNFIGPEIFFGKILRDLKLLIIKARIAMGLPLISKRNTTPYERCKFCGAVGEVVSIGKAAWRSCVCRPPANNVIPEVYLPKLEHDSVFKKP